MKLLRGHSREKFKSPDYVTSPNNHANLKKHWGPRLSILCLLGDQESLVEEIKTWFVFIDSVILINKFQFFSKKFW